ncbi:MAG: sulfatase-like hydrolase/transferase [Verrucomicrobiales bacterium]
MFIFADDLSYELVGGPLAEEVDTPNLDRLRAQGTSFSRAYNSGAWNGAVCVASRAMLMSGLQLWRAKEAEKRFEPDFVAKGRFWPQLLEKGGYATYMTGKWHVKAPVEKAFRQVKNPRPGMPGTVPAAYERDRQDESWRADDPTLGGFWKGGRHWSEVEADTAVDFIAAATKQEQPYFLYLAFNAPHDPRQAPTEFLAKYPPNTIKVPRTFLPVYPYREEMGAPHRLRDEKLAPMPRTKEAVQVHRAEYYALISHLDAQIGRVLDAVEQGGRAKNTYLVFTADHGLAVGNHGLLGKQNMYEHSVRVPFIVKGPGCEAGKVVAGPIYLQDIVPTSLEWAGVSMPEEMDFTSFSAQLTSSGEKDSEQAIFGSYLDRQRSVTQDGYKLILYPKARVARLFHLTEDPFEMTDLLAAGHEKERAQALLEKLRVLQKKYGDPLHLEDFANWNLSK